MESILKADEKFVWHPYTPNPHTGPKVAWKRALGAYVYDTAGRRFYDGTSSWWCITHGHCHPRLVETVQRQAQQMDQVLFAPHTHQSPVELASELCSRLGMSGSRVFFSDNGSTAVECALKVALQYWAIRGTQRDRFLSINLGYHGDTIGCMSVGGIDLFRSKYNDVNGNSVRVNQPYCYRCPVGRNFVDCNIECLSETEDFLAQQGDRFAAVIIEPLVLGAAGMIVYPQQYLDRLVQMCARQNILVIFDEVFSGFGRTGQLFALDTLQYRPDIVCLSKGLTAGMLPLGATVVSDKIHPVFLGPENIFYHGHTFTANPISCAVALENLRIFDEERVLERNQKLIGVLRISIARFSELHHVGQVRHLGMIFAIELVQNKQSKAVPAPANGSGWKIAQALWEKGIWVRPLHNVLYLLPPYCTSEEELGVVLDMLYSEVSDEKHYG